MVDSNDRDRVVEARDELHRMLNEVTIQADISFFSLFLCKSSMLGMRMDEPH